MTNTIAIEKSPAIADSWPHKPTAHISALLADQAREQQTDADYYRHALALVAGWIDAPLALLDIRLGAQTLELKYECEQASITSAVSLLESMSQQDTLSDEACSVGPDEKSMIVLKSPLPHPQLGCIGTLIVAVAVRGRTPHQWLREIQSLASLLVALRAAVCPPRTADKTQDVLQRAAGSDSVRQFAEPLVKQLADRLQCDQVSLGVLDRGRVRIEASLNDKDAAIRELREAMQECAAARRSLACQPAARGDARDLGQPLHQEYQQLAGGSVLSTPLCFDGEPTAVVSFRRDESAPFDGGDVEWVESATARLAPAIHLLKRPETGALAATRRSASSTGKVLRSWQLWLFVGVTAATVLLTALGISTHPYRMTFPGTVAADQTMAVKAPFDGLLAAVVVQPGDHVEAGQVVAKMDIAGNQRRRDEVQAALIEKRSELKRLLAADSELTAVAIAEADALHSELKSLDERIAQAVVLAPLSGTVLQQGFSDPQAASANVLGGAVILHIGAGAESVVVTSPVAQRLQRRLAASEEPVLLELPADGGQPQVSIPVDRVDLQDGAGRLVLEDQRMAYHSRQGQFRVYAGDQPLWWLTLQRMLDWLPL